jgi:C-3',4' desaturase CrtD
MQVLSDRLVAALQRDGGQLLMRHTVEAIQVENQRTTGVLVRSQRTGQSWLEPADHVIANVTVQDLVRLLGDQTPAGYRQRVDKLPPASGAFVVYLGVTEAAIPPNCPPHLQFLYDAGGPIGENNSLFVSVSHAGDGRAPTGYRTITASSFTNPQAWWSGPALQNLGQRSGDDPRYQDLKHRYSEAAIARLGEYFQLRDTIAHQEAATPRTFARFTGRDRGIVGGIGMRRSTFGPFGIANRTPISGLWLVGDSTHPGEGTAGVSYSAWTVVRQIMAS